jgi:hypothetical protein
MKTIKVLQDGRAFYQFPPRAEGPNGSFCSLIFRSAKGAVHDSDPAFDKGAARKQFLSFLTANGLDGSYKMLEDHHANETAPTDEAREDRWASENEAIDDGYGEDHGGY